MVQLLVSYLLIFTVSLMIVAFGGMFAEFHSISYKLG